MMKLFEDLKTSEGMEQKLKDAPSQDSFQQEVKIPGSSSPAKNSSDQEDFTESEGEFDEYVPEP
jgi:hypothetical protein